MIFTLGWLATLFIVLPPMPPTPMQATCSSEFGEALRRIAGKPRTPAAAAVDWRRNWRRFMVGKWTKFLAHASRNSGQDFLPQENAKGAQN